MINIVRRRNARRVVAYSWSEKTGMAKRRFEGAGGPPSADEVFHGLCWLSQEDKEKVRKYIR
jgi:hypothetical protein